MGWPGPLTYRQHEAQVEFWRQSWNEPSLTDWYLMRLTQITVGRGSSDLKSYKIPFKFEAVAPKKDVKDMTPDEYKAAKKEAAKRAKAMWGAALGIDIEAEERRARESGQVERQVESNAPPTPMPGQEISNKPKKPRVIEHEW